MDKDPMTQSPAEGAKVETLVERLRFGCPFKPYSKEDGVAAYDVPKAERVMLEAADRIEQLMRELAEAKRDGWVLVPREVTFDNALNDAGWAVIMEFGNSVHFNDIKQALRTGIRKWIEGQTVAMQKDGAQEEK